MTEINEEQEYKDAKEELKRMRKLRYQGKIGEELIELQKMLIGIFGVYSPWSDIIHGDILHEFGVAHQNLRDYSQALDSLWSAAKLRSRLRYPIDVFYTLHQIVMCEHARGDSVEDLTKDIKQARKAFQPALDYALVKEYHKDCGYILHNHAFYFQLEEKWEEALIHYSFSEEFFKKANNSRGIALSCLRQAQCYLHTNEYSQARGCLDDAEKIFKENGDKKRLEEVEKTRSEIKKVQE